MNFPACSVIARTTSGCDDASRVDGDAGGAIEEAVAIHVLDDGALAAGDDERIVAGVRRRDELAIAIDDGLGLRAWQRGLDVRCVHGCCCSVRGLFPCFQRVVLPVSSSTMPRASRSLRMRSASAKLRDSRAARRASISCSISSTGPAAVRPRRGGARARREPGRSA